jgi:DNA-binding transcriptional LysR family regulator
MAFSSDNVKVFLSVLDHGSFSAAARALGRVPSAVSMVMAQLEAELDLRLFERTPRDVKPTQAARALESQARHLASQLRELEAHALALHQGLERRLKIAIAPELLSTPWSHALSVLADEYPALEVEIVSAPHADALQLLHENVVQLALVFERPGTNEREAFQEIGHESLVAVMSPRHPKCLAQGGRFRQEEMIDIRQIAVTSRNPEITDPRLLVARRIWRTDSHLATLCLVQEGLGWAYLPGKLVGPLLETGELLKVTFDNMSNQIFLWADIVWLKDQPQGLGAKRFIQLMRGQMPEVTSGRASS